MEKSPSQALKCPRCNSSNTKFCYYNNYSLSQPRHFCKACKRYWTRGGTLRNVPVGGGCRKNKRVKRASSSSAAIEGGAISISNSTSNLSPNCPISNSQPQIDISISTSNPHQISPLYYGLHSNPSELNFPSFNSRIDTVSGYDLNALALGFPSGKQIQDSIFGGSLLGSSIVHQQHKFKDNNFQQTVSALTPFEELQLNGNTESAGICMKEIKVELQDQQSRFDWNNNNNNNQNQMDQIGFSSLDPSLYWNPNSSTNSFSAIWHDPANFSSSVTSLI